MRINKETALELISNMKGNDFDLDEIINTLKSCSGRKTTKLNFVTLADNASVAFECKVNDYIIIDGKKFDISLDMSDLDSAYRDCLADVNKVKFYQGFEPKEECLEGTSYEQVVENFRYEFKTYREQLELDKLFELTNHSIPKKDLERIQARLESKISRYVVPLVAKDTTYMTATKITHNVLYRVLDIIPIKEDFSISETILKVLYVLADTELLKFDNVAKSSGKATQSAVVETKVKVDETKKEVSVKFTTDFTSLECPYEDPSIEHNALKFYEGFKPKEGLDIKIANYDLYLIDSFKDLQANAIRAKYGVGIRDHELLMCQGFIMTNVRKVTLGKIPDAIMTNKLEYVVLRRSLELLDGSEICNQTELAKKTIQAIASVELRKFDVNRVYEIPYYIGRTCKLSDKLILGIGKKDVEDTLLFTNETYLILKDSIDQLETYMNENGECAKRQKAYTNPNKNTFIKEFPAHSIRYRLMRSEGESLPEVFYNAIDESSYKADGDIERLIRAIGHFMNSIGVKYNNRNQLELTTILGLRYLINMPTAQIFLSYARKGLTHEEAQDIPLMKMLKGKGGECLSHVMSAYEEIETLVKTIQNERTRTGLLGCLRSIYNEYREAYVNNETTISAELCTCSI